MTVEVLWDVVLCHLVRRSSVILKDHTAVMFGVKLQSFGMSGSVDPNATASCSADSCHSVHCPVNSHPTLTVWSFPDKHLYDPHVQLRQ